MDDKILDIIKTKILESKDYNIVYIDDKINLYDNVVIYSVGNNKFRIVELPIFLAYPIIYDNYSDEEKVDNITIAVCPLSLRSIMLKGKFKINSYSNTKLILEDDKDNIIPIDMNHKIDSKFIIDVNKRYDVKIMTLRDAIIYAMYATYISPNDNIEIKSILNESYYKDIYDLNQNKIESVYHPKTLVYILQFYTDNLKTNILLLGNDIKKSKISGYNLVKSGLTKYLNKRNEKIIDKNGFSIPILLYIAEKEYKNLNIVNLKN